MKIIGILPKSPHPEGRVGSEVNQDWFRQVLEAMRQQDADSSHPRVVISSASKFSEFDEVEYYSRALIRFNVFYEVRREGLETIGHLLALQKIAAETNADLVVIVTKSHYWRTKWICWRKGIKVQLVAIGGIPRPSEHRTDFILTFAYPILDLLGLEKWFQRKVIGHRKEGKLGFE